MRAISVFALALFFSCGAAADPQPGPKRKGPGFMKKGGPGSAPDAVERFSRLTPSERREAMDKLPPERRKRMERRLEAWANTPPEERRRLGGSYARFREMTPEKQQEVRQLFRHFSETFAPDRRPKAQNAIRRLKRADPEERKRLLGSDRFQQEFSEDERKLIEQMANDLPDRD
jgi:uncharacterized protein YktA (UPF0223 family)